MEKISYIYERRSYESVDDAWEPILGYISKIDGKQNSGSKGLNFFKESILQNNKYSITVY